MTALIIGHVTHDSAKLWVRGERGFPRVRISLAEMNAAAGVYCRRQVARLSAGQDYTHVFDFTELNADTVYSVRAEFQRRSWLGRLRTKEQRSPPGRFLTRPDPGIAVTRNGFADRDSCSAEPALSFLVGSCNLVNVKVNNLIGLLVGLAGREAANRSLETGKNSASTESYWRKFFRPLVWFAHEFGSILAFAFSGYRQPGPPFVLSPFLRMSSMLGVTRIVYADQKLKPSVGSFLIGEESGARGYVVFEPRPVGGEERSKSRLSLVRVSKRQFRPKEKIHLAMHRRDGSIRLLGDVCYAEKVSVHRPKRATDFMLHLGDQIYFDFPSLPDPLVENYRQAYREAWMEDRLARHFLAQCPNYMTIDDHEIFNNYACDSRLKQKSEQRSKGGHELSANEPRFSLLAAWKSLVSVLIKIILALRSLFRPTPKRTAENFRSAALSAYRDYVGDRQPSPRSAIAPSNCSACGRTPEQRAHKDCFYYAFSHGPDAHFFVLDTRTERHADEGLPAETRMISCCQMHDLKCWLDKHAKDLVFIVSSVPFVPEVHSMSDEGPIEDKVRASDQDRSVDKWCAPAFKRQRAEIAAHIHARQIQRVVFLSGDVHCCYHASMRIGQRTADKSVRPVTIHELASGPLFQVRLSRAENFYGDFRGYFSVGGEKTLPYVSHMHDFFSLANAVMRVEVDPHQHPEDKASREGQSEPGVTPGVMTQRVRWSVYETIASPQLSSRSSEAEGRPAMRGEISFFCR